LDKYFKKIKRFKMSKKIKIGALISGGGTNLQAIIDSCANGKIDAEILFTGSDVLGVKGLERAKKAGIETFVVDYKSIIKDTRDKVDSINLPQDFDMEEISSKQSVFSSSNKTKLELFIKSRVMAEKQLLDKILPYNIDLLVLAGFMRTFSPYFIDRINTDNKMKIMNNFGYFKNEPCKKRTLFSFYL